MWSKDNDKNVQIGDRKLVVSCKQMAAITSGGGAVW